MAEGSTTTEEASAGSGALSVGPHAYAVPSGRFCSRRKGVRLRCRLGRTVRTHVDLWLVRAADLGRLDAREERLCRQRRLERRGPDHDRVCSFASDLTRSPLDSHLPHELTRPRAGRYDDFARLETQLHAAPTLPRQDKARRRTSLDPVDGRPDDLYTLRKSEGEERSGELGRVNLSRGRGCSEC